MRMPLQVLSGVSVQNFQRLPSQHDKHDNTVQKFPRSLLLQFRGRRLLFCAESRKTLLQRGFSTSRATVLDTVHTMSGALRSLARRAFATAAARPVAAAPKAPYAHMALRAMATGPAASAVKISDELLEKLGSLSTQALIDGLWVMGWPTSHIMGARPLTEGQKKMVGRAVTIQFAAARPDIAADKPGGTESPEYEAFEQVNGKEVVVMSSVGPWESVGGDIKFLRLHQNGVRPAPCPSPGAIEVGCDRVFSTRPVAIRPPPKTDFPDNFTIS